MEYGIYVGIGLAMGLIGGLLGIGGSVVMIPAMTLFFGENQHLYQAAAMIGNFFVAGSSMIAHRRAEALVAPALRWIIPAAVVGIVGGVAVSNSALFAGQRSYLLARIFGGFLVYVAVYNLWKLRPGRLVNPARAEAANGKTYPPPVCAAIGLVTGLGAGLLGIGAGSVATPLQQLFLRMPLRRAMSNSAAMIVSIAWLGAIYKNATLGAHEIEVLESLKIAACVIPTAICGGYIGSHLMHALPKNIVRIAFIGLCILAALKLLTVR